MAVRGLFTGPLDDTSFLNLLFLVRGHGSIETLFSIDGGAQENLVNGGAGAIAAKMTDELGDAIHVSTPVRSITQTATHAVVEADDGVTVESAHVVVTIPPALIPDITFDPVLPDDRATLYRKTVAGPESKTLVIYEAPFWRADGFSGQTSNPHSARAAGSLSRCLKSDRSGHAGDTRKVGRMRRGGLLGRRSREGACAMWRRPQRPERLVRHADTRRDG